MGEEGVVSELLAWILLGDDVLSKILWINKSEVSEVANSSTGRNLIMTHIMTWKAAVFNKSMTTFLQEKLFEPECL